jgi:hypothetical protein
MTNQQYPVALPVRLKWKDESGNQVTEDGMTENVGQKETLVYLPRLLPPVGSKVFLTVSPDDGREEFEVTAKVVRLDRNPAHPQVSLKLLNSLRIWNSKVWSGLEPDRRINFISFESPQLL